MDRRTFIQIRTDVVVFKQRRFTFHSKTTDMLIRDLLFADDCALCLHSLKDIKTIVDDFDDAAKMFGLTVYHKTTRLKEQHHDPEARRHDAVL